VSRAQQIEELASLWVARREEPSWSDADQIELDAWLSQSDANKVAFWRLECGWREADRIASLGAPRRLFEGRSSKIWAWQPLAIAASLAIAFAAYLQWPSLPFSANERIAATPFETAVGGHKIVSLPDGSRVELNTNTAIKAAVDDGTRAIWLDHGEAFFDVAKRAGQRFVIYAGPRTITVLGTKFSVRRIGGEIVVAVLEGRVRVQDSAAGGGDRQATVVAGDVAIAKDRSTLVSNSAQAVEQQLAWRRGQIQLDGITLEAAAAQFNRYNLKQLVISDAEAARIPVAGSFAARNVDTFARLFGEAYGLDVRASPGQIHLSTRRMASRSALAGRPELLASRLPSVRDDASDEGCGSGKAQCALIPVSPASPQPQAASAPTQKSVRDAQNWDVIQKLYPPRARAAGEEGLVGFTVKIDATGSPTACKITHTSSHPLLDLETCQLIMTHASFKRPAGLSPSQQRSYEGVVNWRLPTSPTAAVPTLPKAIAQAAAPEQLICKRILKTGSMALFERRCMTKSDWQRVSSQTRDTWDELQTRGRGSECSGAQCQ
jgi:transmembrane sensor